MQPSGGYASSTNPDTWSAYADVSDRPNGIMLGDGMACWDLDDVLSVDGVHPDAISVLSSVDPLWVECSLSGRGLHVFVAGDGPSHQGRLVSYYSHARFIAVTGARFTHPSASGSA